MKKFTINLLLLTALVLPVVLFWLLTRLDPNALTAAVIAVAAGWALNVAWAFAAGKATPTHPSQETSNFLSIAARFGWVCPSVLVLLTWLVLRFISGTAG
jgi:hypothetical protein